MKKINLKSDELAVNRERRKTGGTSLALGVMFLLFSLGTYGVLSFMNQSALSEIEIVQGELSNLKKKLDGNEFVELYDFQSRLYEVEGLIRNKKNQYELLEKIGAFTLPQTRFMILDNSTKEGASSEIKATFLVPNHYVLSQQIEAYSLMEGVAGISLLKSEQKGEEVQASIGFSMNSSK